MSTFRLDTTRHFRHVSSPTLLHTLYSPVCSSLFYRQMYPVFCSDVPPISTLYPWIFENPEISFESASRYSGNIRTGNRVSASVRSGLHKTATYCVVSVRNHVAKQCTGWSGKYANHNYFRLCDCVKYSNGTAISHLRTKLSSWMYWATCSWVVDWCSVKNIKSQSNIILLSIFHPNTLYNLAYLAATWPSSRRQITDCPTTDKYENDDKCLQFYR
jgi:hypothetical protein